MQKQFLAFEEFVDGSVRQAMSAYADILLKRAFTTDDLGALRRMAERFLYDADFFAGASNVHLVQPQNMSATSMLACQAYLFDRSAHLSRITCVNLHVTGNSMVFTARSLPVVVNNAHVQSGYSQEGKDRNLSYDEDPYVHAIATALLICEHADASHSSISIPLGDGLLRGHMEHLPDGYFADQFFSIVRNRSDKGAVTAGEIKSSWRPNLQIIFNSYIPSFKMNSAQRELHAGLKAVLSAPSKVRRDQTTGNVVEEILASYFYGKHSGVQASRRDRQKAKRTISDMVPPEKFARVGGKVVPVKSAKVTGRNPHRFVDFEPVRRELHNVLDSEAWKSADASYERHLQTLALIQRPQGQLLLK